MNRILVNSNTFHGFSIYDAIKTMKRNGFNSIELTATKGWTEHVFPTMSFDELCKIKNVLNDNDIDVISMSGHTNLMDKERLKDFINNIQLAGFFNCKYIVSSIGEAHLIDKNKTGVEGLVDNITMLIPYLEQNNLMLVLEVHGFEYCTATSINIIVKEINHPLIKICYDTANPIYYGNINILDDFEKNIENIEYIHLKDKAGENNEWNFPAIGKGKINFNQLFNLLGKYNKDVPLSIEIEFTKDGPKDINEIENALNDSFEYLKGIGIV